MVMATARPKAKKVSCDSCYFKCNLLCALSVDEPCVTYRPDSPDGLRPPIWFQQVPEAKAGKNRFHLDLYPTGRDNALPMQQRIEFVEAKVAELTGLGASVESRTRRAP